jgi:hypothetical protein
MRARVWAAGLAAVAVSAGVAGAQTTGDATPQAKSAALRMAPAVAFDKPGRVFASGAQARSAAAIAADSVPLPRGGNFNGVRWEEAGAGLTDVDVQAVQQYNAACQWLRALGDGRDSIVARAILADVPSWPSLRGSDRAQLWADAMAGFPDGEPATAMLADCRASHAREVEYARRLGLPPSS